MNVFLFIFLMRRMHFQIKMNYKSTGIFWSSDNNIQHSKQFQNLPSSPSFCWVDGHLLHLSSATNACHLGSHQLKRMFCPDIICNNTFLISSLLELSFSFLAKIPDSFPIRIPETTIKCRQCDWRERPMFDSDNPLIVEHLLLLLGRTKYRLEAIVQVLMG